jgi:hypothetical protein
LASGTVRKASPGKPLSAYPLFPAFVALWFAALFGLSSLAVGVANLERFVVDAQLNLVIAAAAPPLGTTARILIAVAMTGIGGILGLAIGLLVARANRPKAAAPVTVRARDVHPDAPIRRPISAHEEFGEAEEPDAEAVLDMKALRASSAGVDEVEDLELSAEDSLPAAFGLPIGEAAERIASADLTDLSPVELLERMAIAMQQRLDRRSQAADGEDASDASAVFGDVTVFPALPERKALRASQRSPEETEKALRDALAALQRMTGTG